MDRDLRDKVAVITGGAVGLGLTTADVYLQKGAKAVVLLDLDDKIGAAAADTLNKKHGANKAVYFKCDVRRDLETVSKQVINKFKTIDVLVNNAGILNDFAVKQTIDVNVTALVEWSLKFWEHMRKDKGGKGGTIVNLASIYGYRVDQYLPVYQASKFAVMGFTKSLGHQYNFDRSGVRVYAICPGFTDTDLVKEVRVSDEVQPDMDNFIKQQLWQKPDAVGRAHVESFAKAESGTAWLIEGNKPIAQV